MPTVLLLDVSLSMARPVVVPDSTEDCQRRHLAIHGINTLLDYMNANYRLEFIALTLFASQFESAVSFTRDYESIKKYLNKVEDYGKTCIEKGLDGVLSLVMEEWGTGTFCQVIIITDGRVGIGHHSFKKRLSSLRQRDKASDESSPLPFPFPSKLHVLCIEDPTEPNLADSVAFYQKLIDINGTEGEVFVPEGTLSSKSVQDMFLKVCETYYVPFHGTIRCGNLSSLIQLSPPPEPYHKSRDFEVVKCTFSSEISICGFLDMNDVSSPGAYSRHLVLPLPPPKEEPDDETKMETDAGDEESNTTDDGKTPSFCVLLHGSLKVEGMVALCQLGEDWYGMLYSWADNKKKSNLMLTVFEPGLDSVPWLGKFNMLSIPEAKTSHSSKSDEGSSGFPVKPSEKRSYAQSSVVWIRQSGLQADIQKILRHARKLPEKMQNFYKELNRMRRAALSFGFFDLLDGMASILERECTLLPGTAHPDAALQLTHAANALRGHHFKDYNILIMPLRTKFTSDDMS